MIENKFPAKIDVAVLLLFFTRTDSFEKVFEAVREARPSKLFLYQDGPRGERDMAGIEACRKIAENIDWECDVYRKYQERNYGCDPSEYLSQKWAFSIVDKCIVLEDDDVPSQSFFPFCKEMLDRYEHNERISMISGFNTDEVTPDVNDDYFFTSVQAIWGWASWRRVIDRWQGDYKFLDDEQAMRLLKNKCKYQGFRAAMIDMAADHRKSGKEYYRHSAMNNVLGLDAYSIPEGYVFCNGNTARAGKVTYFPIYMLMFLQKEDAADSVLYDTDFSDVNRIIP